MVSLTPFCRRFKIPVRASLSVEQGSPPAIPERPGWLVGSHAGLERGPQTGPVDKPGPQLGDLPTPLCVWFRSSVTARCTLKYLLRVCENRRKQHPSQLQASISAAEASAGHIGKPTIPSPGNPLRGPREAISHHLELPLNI